MVELDQSLPVDLCQVCRFHRLVFMDEDRLGCLGCGLEEQSCRCPNRDSDLV
jgi:hypothetical protein